MRVLNPDGILRLAEAGGPKNLADDRGHGSLQDPTAPPAFLHLIQALLRRRWMILAIATAGTLFAAILALLVPPQYTAKAQLTVERPSGAGQASERVLDEIIDTHLALIASPDHLRHVADSLRPPQPENAEAAAPAAPPSQPEATDGSPPDGAKQEPGFIQRMMQRLAVWIPALSGRSEADLFLENLFRKTQVIQERRSRLITVAFTSPDPQTAATYANRIAEAYVDSLRRQMEEDAAERLKEIDRQIAAARAEVQAAQQAVQDAIRRRVAASSPDAAADADREIRDLTRASRETVEFHDNLLRRRTELKEAQASIRPGIDVHSRAAVPTWPSSHNPLLFVIPSAVLSLMAGCWLALILERADRRLRSEREVQRVLGIPCIGHLPRVRAGTIGAPRLHILNHPTSPYSEAVRNIAAALQAHHTGRGSRVVLVTSSVAGEGKSTLATGLSAYFGTLGRRVLLIDLDILPASEREPAALAVCRSPSREQMRAMIAPQPELGVDYLGLSRLGVDPLLFFEPEGLPRLLTDLRKSYDVIVVGGPPVLGSSEARLLPSIADQVLFVVRWASTKRDVAEHALSFLRRFRAVDEPSLGSTFAVLSHVKVKQARLSVGGADGSPVIDLGPVRPTREKRLPARTAEPATPVEGSV